MDLKALVQIYADKLAPLKKERWLFFSVIFVIYVIRIYWIQKFYLITYCLFIYLLHGLIEFLTPKDDNIVDPFEDYENVEYESPVTDEFRPFIRRMPEYKFFIFCSQLVLSAFAGTFIDLLDFQVYVPVLVIYFLSIFGYTVYNLNRHMRKYKYNPFYVAKDVYRGRK